MPRKPSRPSVVRKSRQILGLTQPELARLVGCSRITLEKFENGSATFISDDLVARIAGELGLNFWQLRENWNPEETPTTINGEPLSIETYEKLKAERQAAISKERVDQDRRVHQMFCALLFDAAVKSGKYFALRAALARQSEALIREFGLEKEWSAMLKHHGLKEIPIAPHLAFRSHDPKELEKKREKLYSQLTRQQGKLSKKPKLQAA
jgi:transcriptional regulator with XRE-family HTH domain